MKGIGATGASGRSSGSVGVSPTGIELGLNVGGIGQLGISTDYGGGIVVAIFGQKIVWGREGGKIHYNFGGLEVIVEARSCVVTETRKILGQIVGRHAYPDPGCKLPEPPKEEPISPPTTPEFGEGIKAPETEENGWMFFNAVRQDSPTASETMTVKAENYVIPVVNGTPVNAPADLTYKTSRLTTSEFFALGTRVGNLIERFSSYGDTSDTRSVIAIYKPNFGNWFGVFGTGKNINAFFPIYKAWSLNRFGTAGGGATLTPHTWIPLVAPKLILPPPSAGNQPPMPESCCESLKADIEDIKEVLATKEILAGKMTFPWKWRMPGGEGEEIIMDYPNLARAIAQQIDHLGIHPPKLSIKDINNAIAGDQSINNQFPSATQAFEALMAQVWDANADVDTLTNFLYRLAWLCVQQSFNLAQLTGTVESLKDMMGGGTEQIETELTTPFNIAAGTGTKITPPGKGFGKQANKSGAIDNRIDANTEMSTEAMLPEFLKIRENPILIDTFSGNQDVFTLLQLIRADLEKIKNK
ncbi:hypothetical protein QUA82_09895 [Microcoleus sp. F8-D3]